MSNLVRALCRFTVSLLVMLFWLPAIADAAGQEKARAADTKTEIDRVKPALLPAGKERSTRKPQGEKQGAYALEDGQTVPAERLDGGVAGRTSTGGVIYGRGVSVTADGDLRYNGKVVRTLSPGENLTMDELRELTKGRPAYRRPSERPAASAAPMRPITPAGGADIAGAPSDFPTTSPSNPRSPDPGRNGIPSGSAPTPINPPETGSSNIATPGTSRTGEAVFVLGNGTQVPSDLGNGITGTPDSSGGVNYSDGRTATVDPATGDTVFANADGTEASRYTPAREGTGTTPDGNATETFVMPNGNHVPREQGGGTGVPNGRGGVTYPDGSRTEYDSDTGETVFFDNQGQEFERAGSQQAYPSTTSDGRSVYVMTNGETVPREGPDGQMGTPNSVGGVDYEGGLSTNPTEGGRTVVTGSPVGNYIVVTRSTDEAAGDTFDLGNGTSVPVTGRGGQGRIAENGAGVVYDDGTFVSVDAKTGDTVIQYPNGRSEVLQGQNNRKDAANYVYTTSGDSSGNGSSSSSSGKKDSSDNRSSKDTKSASSDDDKGSKDQDDDDSSDDSSDDGSDEGGEDGGKDSDDTGGEGADKNLGAEGNAGNDPESKRTVDDALARKTGEKKEPDSTGPAGCDDGRGRGGPPGGVAEPGPGQQNCVPGGLQPGADEEDEAEPAPVLNSPSGNDFKRDDLRPDDLVGQPGFENDGITNEGRTLENKLKDIKGITNPIRNDR